ncbi:MAG TPA: hypothetical protein VNQ80_18940 [Parapedobacter sp.]|uniref:hypothetical protein n=1 Tax=Parapedobacter sp. TaxID=1958893 RepID=UPI002B99F6D4|nr:hypothetical protein [Parapedobacter sp.]HWK59427.1 hypothetical protein [Parapedobacter sp.]
MATATYNKRLGNVFLIQGVYFVVTGIWPLLNMASFIMATGPKQDTWLVEMVGLLSAAVGLTFIVSSLRRHPLPVLLGYTVSASFLLMDIVYVANGQIDRIYLLDAAIQAAFIAVLTVILILNSRKRA